MRYLTPAIIRLLPVRPKDPQGCNWLQLQRLEQVSKRRDSTSAWAPPPVAELLAWGSSRHCCRRLAMLTLLLESPKSIRGARSGKSNVARRIDARARYGGSCDRRRDVGSRRTTLPRSRNSPR